MKDYVTQLDGAYRITDSRVSLDSIVYAWRDGLSPDDQSEIRRPVDERRISHATTDTR